jgi:homogentisate 1,2-dioxygenase
MPKYAPLCNDVLKVNNSRELAVMVDTFHPLHLTKDALKLEKPEYMDTWMDGNGE